MKLFTIKKSVLAFAAAVIAVSAAIGGAAQSVAASAVSSAPVIVVDAGHGGIDAGVRGIESGTKESDINLAISNYLQGYLSGAGFTAVMTRKTQAGLYGLPVKGFKKRDMQKRRDIINDCSADMVISVHQNFYSDRSRYGATVFFDKNSECGKNLAACIQESFNAMPEKRKQCNALTGDYYMLQCTQSPSVIVECGFLSNAEDEKLLITEEYQKSIAYHIFMGVVSYFS